MKKLTISLLLAAMLAGVSYADLYPATMRVVDLDTMNDTVYCSDCNGNEFSFYGCEDYMIGDLVSLIMNDNATIEIYDDAIVDSKYAGYSF